MGKVTCTNIDKTTKIVIKQKKISDTARKEAKEGRTYESNIGLNLNLSETSGEVNITLSNTEFCAVHFKRQNKKNIQM